MIVGFVYAPVADFGASGAVPAFSEEANLANAFGVGFDTFNNGDMDGNAESSVSLHYNEAVVANLPLDGTALATLENSVVHTANINIVPNGSGADVSVSISDGVTTLNVADGIFVDGVTPYDGRMIFNARTGGANSQQDIDNITLMHTDANNHLHFCSLLFSCFDLNCPNCFYHLGNSWT